MSQPEIDPVNNSSKIFDQFSYNNFGKAQVIDTIDTSPSKTMLIKNGVALRSVDGRILKRAEKKYNKNGSLSKMEYIKIFKMGEV